LIFRDHLRVLSRRWPVIALVTVLGTGAGTLDGALTTPEYRATATVFVSLQGGGDAFQLSRGTPSPRTGSGPTSRWRPGRR
jgi:uncharacterized protein involved in exopolysaccharide biosynthesis